MANAVDDIDVRRAVEDDAQRMGKALLGLYHCLPTTAAGRDGLREEFASIACGNGYGGDGDVGELRSGGKQSGSLGTDGHAEGRILLVATYKRFAIGQEHSRSNAEVGILGIRACGGFDGSVNKLLLSVGELVFLTNGNGRC